ncbi:MAG: hypothetical protein ACRD16_06625 [Thermoanaerobaculia bacterium]
MTLLRAAVPVVLAVLWTDLTGLGAARRLLSRLTGEEKIAWGFGAGMLLQSAIFSVLVLFRLPTRPLPMFLYGLVLALALCRLGRREDGAAPRAGAVPKAARALLVLAAAACALFLLQAVVEPMWANDYLAVWGLKAKTISLSSAVPSRLFHDPAAAFSHPEYPLVLPLFLAAISALAGSWNDHALALLFPAFEAALLLGLFGFFRRRGKPRGGAVAALLVSLLFFLFQAFEVGMADIPLSFALVLLALAAVDLDEPQKGGGAAGRAAIAALLCCGLKQEGTLFVVLLAGALALRSLRGFRRKALAPSAVMLAAALTNWGLLRLLRGSLTDRDYDLSLPGGRGFPVLLARLSAVWATVLRAQVLPLAIPAAALALFLILTPRTRLDFLLAVLGAQFVAYVSVCALSSVDPLWQAQFIPRIAAALFPVLCAVLGERFGSLFEGSEGRVRAFSPAVKVRGK